MRDKYSYFLVRAYDYMKAAELTRKLLGVC
jgi:hypothetical protein